MDWTKEVRRNRKKILVAVLSLALLVLVLGLGLGLGLELNRCQDKGPAPSTSCRGRCFQPYDDSAPGCRCDSACNATNSCCYDFQHICTQPAHQWECSSLRCGELRGPPSLCSCSLDCLTAGDCCANYRHACQGETQWVEDECDDLVTPACPSSFQKQPVLLVSLDGLRAEYLHTWSDLLPVLNKLRTCGTSASYMQAAFPSKTFPNHYTIVTGLYPESNGLIDNVMYDPDLNASFSLSSPEKDNPAWYLGQPIWNTVRYEGLKSGTFFWPGSDVKINGSFPDIYRPYDGSVPFEERVFSLLKWLQLPEGQRPDFYTLYLEEPDKSGHSFGPVSGGLIASLQAVDDIIGQLMNGLKQLRLHRCVNILLLADHGMEETSCSRKEVLQNFVGDTSSLVVIQGPFSRIRAKNRTAGTDSAGLVANMTCQRADQKIKAFLKADLPKRLHFANSRRIEDVNVLVEPRWLLESAPGSLTFCSGGTHGYDNDADSMHAMFLSYGPKFLSRTEVEPFSNVELYNLMCDLLQIRPAENNGTHGSLNHLLREPFFSPAPPPERSAPTRCPLLALDPGDALGCSCPVLTGNSINSRLNLSSEAVSSAERKHTPLGRPRLLPPGLSVCLLQQEGFISAYSLDARMPLWSSFTVDRPGDPDPFPPETPGCLRADVRVPAAQSQRCDDYGVGTNLTHAFLYPPSLNSSEEQQFDGLLVTNLVPMFTDFKRIWDYFHYSLLKKYASLYNGINVVVGPVFDSDYDGRMDTLDQRQQVVPGTNISVPTHYFVLLTSCRNSSQLLRDCLELQTASFLLPHGSAHTHSCKNAGAESDWVEEVMWLHQARVRDVEWISGLDFYQDSHRPITELLQLKTRPTAAIHRKRSEPPV